MPTSAASRAADRAARTEATLEMLVDRLPDIEPSGRTTFSDLWKSVSHFSGILGRNDFYTLLEALDGARLEDAGLIIRVGRRATASRRVILVRPLRPWNEQRMHLRRYLARGRVHPPEPVSYAQAHRRVRTERGPASAQVCGGCGDDAAEWSYSGFSPDEQIGWVGEPGAEILRAWSPVPSDYSPLCRECHWHFDEQGVIWGVGPGSGAALARLHHALDR